MTEAKQGGPGQPRVGREGPPGPIPEPADSWLPTRGTSPSAETLISGIDWPLRLLDRITAALRGEGLSPRPGPPDPIPEPTPP